MEEEEAKEEEEETRVATRGERKKGRRQLNFLPSLSLPLLLSLFHDTTEEEEEEEEDTRSESAGNVVVVEAAKERKRERAFRLSLSVSRLPRSLPPASLHRRSLSSQPLLGKVDDDDNH